MKKTTYEMNSKNNIQRHFLRPLIIAMAMITAVPLALQGQETFTGEGLYYISTKGTLTQAYNTNNHDSNFYLCPSVGWYYYQSTSPYYTNTYNGMPFLTTYKCQGTPSYDANSAIWIIKESGTTGYYHIIRAIDGKYLTFNEAMGNNSNVGRMRVHLQDTPDGDKALFKINYISGPGKNCYDIIPYSAQDAQDNRKYINVTDGNKESLQASGKKDGPSGIATGGIIGLWNKGSNDNENTSKWTFEAATKLPAPIVTQTSLGHYEITPDAIFYSLPTGYTIKFSTDGSVVDENSENYPPGSTIEITTSGTLIASIWAHGMEITQQVVQTVSAGIETPTFNVHCDNSLELSCGSLGAGIKYVINDNEPTHCTIEYTNPITTGLHDGDIVYARSYIGSDYSNVEQFTYYTNTADPTVTLTDNSANLTFSGTADIYYTTNGQDPVIDKNGLAGSGTTMLDNQTNTASITISSDNDVELHIVAKQADRGYSCPVTVVKRPKQPTINAQSLCYNSYRAHELTFTNTESGKTYWYALSNGSGQTPPATNTFREYTPSETVEITSIPGFNPSSATVTLHAYTKDGEGNISVIKSQDYSLDYTPAPTFSYSNNTITITAETGATINYSVNGVNQSDATTSATVNVSIGTNVIVVATATLGSSNPSCEVTYRVSSPISITDLAGLNGMILNRVYRLDADIEDASSYTSKGTEENPFTGTFDGNGHTINGLTQPLFGVVNGGVVKNMTLKGVNINSSADNVGAIAGVVKGYSRIFNCGILPNSADFPDGQNSHPKVKTTGSCAGGLVGSLRDNSRVVNCFSYADVTATDSAAGIVGNNTFASTTEVSKGKYTKLCTMVVNCMFYGDILGGTNQYGVYGGKLITNAAATGISNYNYFRNGTKFTAANGYKNTKDGSNVVGNPTAYNCSFPAEERYLTQVEFHRSLLNSNRELCGWWIGSDVAPSTLTTAQVQAIPKDASLIYKWVVDPNIAPYPILKPFGKYPSVVNGNTGTPWFDREAANEYEGKKLGTLSVTVKSGVHSSAADQTLTIPITDMDTLHHDYCYRKIQLPYFNTVFGNPNSADWTAKYAGNYSDYVVTGWKVTAVTGGTQGTFLADWQYGYNFADRKCTAKDIYSENNKRVFAQGGNYYVPDGVTAITIEAYWGKAIYVCDDSYSYDRVNITEGKTGTHFAPAGTRDSSINGYTVYNTKIRDVIDNITEKHTVYDHAIVLVGNVQESNSNNAVTVNTDNTIGFTIMSVDLDFDEEPDYCLEWQLGTGTSRNAISPVRFDFLPVVELGIAGKLNESQNFFSLGCFRSCGHFEVTETAFIRFGQFEFERKTRDEGPVILNGGIYDQYTRGTAGDENTNNNQHINYVILGGHVVMPSFTPGAHVNENAKYQTRHCAVNALGGDFTSFYLTGGYNEAIAPYDDNPHCYIDGGHFGTIAAAYKEGIAGNVTWRINHALIGEFYGGGVMSQKEGNYKIVKGNIDVVIDSSIVGKYCGGPKFGDMESDKTVTTSATGTTFGFYYGAGNGGTNYVQYASTDAVGSPYSVNTWNNTVNDNYHPNQYRNSSVTKAPNSYEADYEYEQINTSTGTKTDVVNRSYYYSAQFATTNTGNVTSTLTGCTVLNNFYGAGFLGGVTGTVTSTLTDTRVMGSAFGAGYSASSGTVTIHNKDKKPPVVNTYTGMITYNPEGTSTTYNWTDKTSIGGHPLSTSEPEATYEGKNYFYTEISLDNLGAVSKDVVLTINGNSEIGGNVGGGNVFGGGDQSAVVGNATVKIQGNAKIHGNVYGGGNKGTIGGNASVEIK